MKELGCEISEINCENTLSHFAANLNVRQHVVMKRLVIALMPVLLCAGCVSVAGLPEVTFEWFNLSTNQIWVVEVVGLPPEAHAGRLMPSPAEEQLRVAASTYSETVRIKDRIRIVSKDNGAQGWPGGLKSGELVPPGVSHEAEFRRAELGIPARLTHGKLRFTYLGGDKWRVKLYGRETTFKGTDSVKEFSPPYTP